jgi:hypothetical protein
MRAPDSRGSSCIFIPGFCQFRASWDTDLHRTWKFQVDFTKALLLSNFQGLDMINGGYLSALPSSHTFQVGVGQQFCPCFSAGFDLVTSTGHNYLLTLPDLGNRWILGTSHNTMLGRFEPRDSRSINITTVPDN